jgi:hypothetical protein
MIELYSFEEWDAMQDQEKEVEWGSANGDKDSQMVHHSMIYKDAPLNIREMFYHQYVAAATNCKN